MLVSPDQLTRMAPLRSGSASGSFGWYYHHLLTARVSGAPDKILGREDVCRFVRENKDENAQLTRAMENTAYIHELRHFHDCFATFAGISLFRSFLSELRAFKDICRHLWQKQLSWQLPLTNWAKEADCPPSVRKFVDAHRRFTLLRDVFLGALQPQPRLEDQSAESLLGVFEVEGTGVQFPAYPLQFQVGSVSLTDGRISNDFKTTISWYPIAFEALIEANAQAIQRDVLEALWPKKIADLAWSRMTRGVELVHDDDFDKDWRRKYASSMTLPYNVTDYLLTKFCKTRYGRDQFPRKLILQLSDYALMNSHCQSEFSNHGVMQHPGERVLEALGTLQWEGIFEEAVLPTIITKKDLQALRDKFASEPKPETLERSGNFVDPVDAIESFVAHHIIVPLLDLRIRLGDGVINDTITYFENLDRFPVPPIWITGDDVRVSPLVSPYVGCQWARFVVLYSVMEQLLNDQPIISCPRAYDSVPGIGIFELCHIGNCNDHIQARECLAWAHGRLSELPDCWFRNVLKLFGFERENSPKASAT